jgi:hypothetical protein
MSDRNYFDKHIEPFSGQTKIKHVLQQLEEKETGDEDHIVVDHGSGKFRTIQVGAFKEIIDEEDEDLLELILEELDNDELKDAHGLAEDEVSEISPNRLIELAHKEPANLLVITDSDSTQPVGRIWSPTKGGRVYEAMFGDDNLEPPERYANAVLAEERGEGLLDTQEPIDPGAVVRLRVDIGELSEDSAVVDPEPLPLPDKDFWLEVMLSSTDFEVGNSLADLESLSASHTASSRLFVPKDGTAATTEDGDKYLYFYMRAPEVKQVARARVGYYYRNSLLQSQVLVADVGEDEGGYIFEIDYTLSRTFTGLQAMPKIPTLSILTNSNSDGTHQIVVRAGDKEGKELGTVPYTLDEDTIGKVVQDIRKTLASRAPKVRQRKKKELISDLRMLAPKGLKLWHGIIQNIQDLYGILDQHDDMVIQISRPQGKRYAFPWGLIYDIPIEDGNKAQLCSLIEKWDGQSPLIDLELRECPEVPNGIHDDNTLCPFGFWGFRYPIEQLASTDHEVFWIYDSEPNKFEMMVGETQYEVNTKDLEAHVNNLRKLVKGEYPEADVYERKDKDSIKELFHRDLPLIYFYCHGERPRPGDPNTYLGVGKREAISAEDIRSWLLTWKRRDKKVVWEDVRPLIFINACHSIEINPDTLTNYLDTFVTEAHAAGVIGTEVKVNQHLAMEMADIFFDRFLQDDWSLDRAMHYGRTSFLAHGNLFGLAYSNYSRASLQFFKG